MDQWHDDVKVDDLSQEFLRFFRAFIPEDRDIFFKILEEEYKKLKEEKDLDLKKSENNELIETFKEEIQEVEKEIIQQETNELIENLKEEVNEIKKQEISEISIEEKIQKEKNQFIKDNQEELENLELVKNKDDKFMLYSEQMIFPQNKMEEFEKKLKNNPEAKIDEVLNINDIKNNLQKEQEFQKIFTEEVASLSDEAPSLEKEQKLNPDNYFKDLINWFDKKKLENEKIPLTKEEFKNEFLEYCKNGMSENEMKILLLLANKEPSKLTQEHKDMIKDGLKFNLTNQKLLDQGLETAIRAEIGEKIINNNIGDLVKSVEKMKKTDNLIDKKMLDGTIQNIADKIKTNNKHLTTESMEKLNAITNNKEIQKSKGRKI